MSDKSAFLKELKGLGSELSNAFKQIQKSKEFQDLRKEVGTSVKRISDSLLQSLEAAQKSQSTRALKRRVKRVVKAGAVEGTAEMKKAQQVATKGFRRVRSALKDVKNNLN